MYITRIKNHFLHLGYLNILLIYCYGRYFYIILFIIITMRKIKCYLKVVKKLFTLNHLNKSIKEGIQSDL